MLKTIKFYLHFIKSEIEIHQKSVHVNVKVPICLVAPAPPALELLVDGVPQTVVGELYSYSIFWENILSVHYPHLHFLYKVRPGDALLTTCHAKTGNPVPEVQVNINITI